MNEIAKLFFLVGIIFILSGGILFFVQHKIPGLGGNFLDISIKRDNFRFEFPLGSCIFISIFLTIIINIFMFFFNKR